MSVAGRVVCPHCGANNFDTQAACWKCGASLGAAAPASAPPASVRPAAFNSPSPVLAPAPAAAAPYRPNPIDPSVAIWSAIALGVLFPFFAVPAGIVFLMMDDRRKAEVGRVTLVWGIIGTIFHTLITAWMIKGAVDQVRAYVPFLNRPGASAPGGAGLTFPPSQEPSLTGPAPQDAVRDLKFPAP